EQAHKEADRAGVEAKYGQEVAEVNRSWRDSLGRLGGEAEALRAEVGRAFPEWTAGEGDHFRPPGQPPGGLPVRRFVVSLEDDPGEGALTPNPSPQRGEGGKAPLSPDPAKQTPLLPDPSPPEAEGEGGKRRDRNSLSLPAVVPFPDRCSMMLT